MDEAHRRRNMELYCRNREREEAAAKPKPAPKPRLTRTQRLSRDKVFRYLAEERLYRDEELTAAMRDEVPDAWHTIEHDLDVTEPKVKVTLWLDGSTAKFYRAMGRGYQARINRILGLWAHLKIAKFIDREKRMKEMWG